MWIAARLQMGTTGVLGPCCIAGHNTQMNHHAHKSSSNLWVIPD